MLGDKLECCSAEIRAFSGINYVAFQLAFQLAFQALDEFIAVARCG